MDLAVSQGEQSLTGLKLNERIWQIECNGEPVSHMFDWMGSETFDPTQAVTIWGGAYKDREIAENDVFTFTLLADGVNG